MEVCSDGQDDMTSIEELRTKLETRIQNQRLTQRDLISSLQTLIPDIVSSIDLSLKVVSTFNGREYTTTPIPNPNSKTLLENRQPTAENLSRHPCIESKTTIPKNPNPKPSPRVRRQSDGEKLLVFDSSCSPLAIVRSMVAVCLLERVPFEPIGSSTLLRKLENDEVSTPVEKSALLELGGESGAILAVEMALRSIADENGGVQLENHVVSGQSRVMVIAIDRFRLVKELPESSLLQQQQEPNSIDGNQNQNQEVITSGGEVNGGEGFEIRGVLPRLPDMWPGHGDPNFSWTGGGNHFHRPPRFVPNPARTEEEDMKNVQALVNKKSFKEMENSKIAEELNRLIHEPTHKEIVEAEKFKSKGGSQLNEFCKALTKEDCRRRSGSYFACKLGHYMRIIAPHTDISLGDCSFLNSCRHMRTCKYVHYEIDSTVDVFDMMMRGTSPPPPKPFKQSAEYCSKAELGEPQWINCDIRNFRVDILGQFGVIMADPPWDIHMELPYGTMPDNEMRKLNVQALQTDGLIFLWVTGRAMELGRECLELWGYKCVEEIIWVKTNQLERIIRTGRTGHWLNHSKEHCLVGIKGNPTVNKNIDTDVIVAEVRETSRKPDEMYALLERISPRTRKLELFARMHNTHAGWMSLGNQLQGVRLVDEGLRARFKAAYPDVEVQPSSPPRSSAMDVEPIASQTRNPFARMESKSTTAHFAEPQTPLVPYTTDVEMRRTPATCLSWKLEFKGDP